MTQTYMTDWFRPHDSPHDESAEWDAHKGDLTLMHANLTDQPPTALRASTASTASTIHPNAAAAAAAATAIRTLPFQPTNVAQVQTKRTARRSASVSSEGSRRGISPAPSLRPTVREQARERGGRRGRRYEEGGATLLVGRRTSVSPMSERSFRSASPLRPRSASASHTAASAAILASSGFPPLPLSASASAAATPSPPPLPSSHGHSQSLGGRSFVLAQQGLHLASSQQTREQGGAWFSGPILDSTASARLLPGPAATHLPETVEDYASRSSFQEGRPTSGSSASVNFSYPSRLRVASPPPFGTSPTLKSSSLVTHANPTSATPLTHVARVTPASAASSASFLPPDSHDFSPVRPRVRATSIDRAQPPRHASASASAAKMSSAVRRSASMSRAMGRSSASDQTLVYDPNSRRMVPRAELLSWEQEARDMAEREQREREQREQREQPHKKKPQHPAAPKSVPMLAHELRFGPSEPEEQEWEPEEEEPDRQQTRHHPESDLSPADTHQQGPFMGLFSEKDMLERHMLEFSSQPPALSLSASTSTSSPFSASPEPATQASTAPPYGNPASFSHSYEDYCAPSRDEPHVVVKRPSIVREEPEREEEEELKGQVAPAWEAPGPEAPVPEAPHVQAPVIQPVPAVPLAGEPPDSQVRTAHFASSTGSLLGNLTVLRHSPPPRSISPRKSAMKQTSPSRDTSPIEGPTAELGDAASTTRKRPARVSFTDAHIILPIHDDVSATSLSLHEFPPTAPEPPASTATQPPASRRSWFSNIGRSKKKEAAVAAAAPAVGAGLPSKFKVEDDDDENDNDEDDDTVMKPRPALPFFGSVRERVAAAQPAGSRSERPLVPPPEHGGSSSIVAPEWTAASTPSTSLASSSSGAIRNEANTSRYREPLPPVVTSVDGSGYVSDTDSTSGLSLEESETSFAADARVPSALGSVSSPDMGAKVDTMVDTKVEAEAGSEVVPATPILAPIPTISITAAQTPPRVSASVASVGVLADVPGTFPSDSDADSSDSRGFSEHAEHAELEEHKEQTPVMLEVPGKSGSHDSDRDSISSDSDESSIYSDAREDLSEVDGDGFLSLDAVVSSPIQPVVLSKKQEKQPEPTASAESTAMAASPASNAAAGAAASSSLRTGGDDEDWDRIKALWRGLSAEKRARLERETAEESKTGSQEATVVTADTQLPAADPSVIGHVTMPTTQQTSQQKQKQPKAEQTGMLPRIRKSLRSGKKAEPVLTPSLRPTSLPPSPAPASPVASLVITSPSHLRTVSDTALVSAPAQKSPSGGRKIVRKSRPGAVSPPVSLTRHGSDSSQSSFKRARARSVSSSRGGGSMGSMGFRQSMRRDSAASADLPNLKNKAAGSGRFSVRSLSPPRQASLDSRLYLRQSMRDGSGVSGSGKSIGTATIRPTSSSSKHSRSSSTGFFSSLGRTDGGSGSGSVGNKLLRRGGRNTTGSRFQDSSDDDDDLLYGSGAKKSKGFLHRGRHSRTVSETVVSTSSTFRSRFVDSSDEEDLDMEDQQQQRQQQRQQQQRAKSGQVQASPPLPEELEESDVEAEAEAEAEARQAALAAVRVTATPASGGLAGVDDRRTMSLSSASDHKRPAMMLMRHASGGGGSSGRDRSNSNIGTSSIRRSRSGRGSMIVMSPVYSPTAGGRGEAGPGAGSMSAEILVQASQAVRASQDMPRSSFTQRRQAAGGGRSSGRNGGGFMSVLRRKKTINTADRHMESAARRDTQLERSQRELQAVRRKGAEDEEDEDEDEEEDEVEDEAAKANWPLPEAQEAQKVAGGSSGGGDGPVSMSTETVTDGGSVARGPKKKKFPALRKIFRLDD